MYSFYQEDRNDRYNERYYYYDQETSREHYRDPKKMAILFFGLTRNM
jgi:hypothetical protein